MKAIYYPSASSVLWTPAVLNPVARYLEPATAAGTVSSLSDQSGNGWTLNQFLGVQRPTIQENILNNKSVITFAGNNSIATTNNFSLTGDAGWTVLVVYRKTVAANGSLFGWGLTNVGSPLTAVGLLDDNSSFRAIAYAGANNYNISAPPLNAWNIYVFTKAPGAINTNSTARLNGVDASTTGHSVNTPNVRAAPLALGRWADYTPNALTGSVAEFAVFPGAANLANVQRLEGYAASSDAWGLTANLPADHPYKTTPPTV